jgi:hypothetical protein
VTHTSTITADGIPKRGRGRPRGSLKKPPAPDAEAPVKPKLTRFNVPLDGRDAWSIDEFCIQHAISKSSYYNLKRKGEGPRETHVGTKILISRKDAADWLRKRGKRSA